MLLRILLLLLLPAFLGAQTNPQNYPAQSGSAQYLGGSPTLRSLARKALPAHSTEEKDKQLFPREVPNFTGSIRMPRPEAERAAPQGADPLYQSNSTRSGSFELLPERNFDGAEQMTEIVNPPDPCGDHNGEVFVQMTNSSLGSQLSVYDAESELSFKLPSLNSLWGTFNVSGAGDPIVLYDQFAGRWLVTEFQSGGNALLIAVSQTEDPAGSYNVYRVVTPGFPDYPKYSVWNNAYIVTTNEPSSPTIPIYALERSAMLQGLEADVQRLGIPKFGSGVTFEVATPVDWDGNNPPPPGSPGYVVRLYDDAWLGGTDKIELWSVNIDWDNEDNSFMSGPTELAGAPFDSGLCPEGGFFINCIEQPSGVRVDALQDIILHRVPYLNFGSHESIVLNFAVDVDGNDRAGLRWMELRRAPGGSWGIHQEGTYAQDDGLSRFVGGIAMDLNGNMLLAYSVGGPDKIMSLRMTGRRASDPPGLMTVDEYEFATGLSDPFGSRWGDYASMSLDPSNGRTFWFTGPYMKTNNGWGTKIMSAELGRDSFDVGPQALLSPQTSGDLETEESVKLRIRNFGLFPLSGISLGFALNGTLIAEEQLNDTLPPDSSLLYTFTPTVDLSEIGTYDFQLFTTQAADSNPLNDTLLVRVEQLPRNDVSVAGVVLPDGVICSDSVLASILLGNEGTDTLFSASVSYTLNGSTAELEWEGVLPPGSEEELIVNLSPVLGGTNTLQLAASMPNGVVDERPGNNEASFELPANPEGREVFIRLITDDFPNETSWELATAEGEVLVEAGPFPEDNSIYDRTLCLSDGCYELRLFDSFGDGLLGPPPGGLSISAGDTLLATLLKEEANFGTEKRFQFCLPFTCLLDITVETEKESEPGANNAALLVEVTNAVPPIAYSVDGGQSFQDEPLFLNLPGGTYEVLVRDGNGCEQQMQVDIPTCDIMLSAEVQNTPAGVSEGQIEVQVEGGNGTLLYSLDGFNFQPGNTFDGLPAGDYTVFVRDGIGCTARLELTINVVSSAQTHFAGRQIQLWPNPTDGYVRLKLVGSSRQDLLPFTLFDLEGQAVRHGELVRYGDVTEGICSLYGLPSGTYWLRLSGLVDAQLFKIIKH